MDDGDASKRRLSGTRGCNCKRSHCEKKYCECFQAGRRCTKWCRCDLCRNMGEHGSLHVRRKLEDSE